ncbi:hypothetical protein ALC56_14476 [Trachymyrmex septentrionalis]|uniref:Uncharacterized protein n=1 Tax=Trachymyrmex septentrionalis TaxID=34720 RepID=A0A195ESK7_9HYME|nr:hypothetical protein ALC56_14476 [Trachymyrmex septentrionalis]
MKLLDTRRRRTAQTDGALTIALSYRLPLIIDMDGGGSPDPNFVVVGFDSEATNERTVHASSGPFVPFERRLASPPLSASHTVAAGGSPVVRTEEWINSELLPPPW